MLHLAHSNQQRKNLEMEGLEGAIEDMRLHHMGFGVYPMRDIHQQAYLAYFSKGKTSECLKLALKIYYQVEPMISPPIYEDYRLCTLYTIISLLNYPPPEAINLEPLPLTVLEMIPKVFLPLRHKLAVDTERCYGADSLVGQYERQFFVKTAERLQNIALGTVEYQTYEETDEQKEISQSNMKSLLAWAGIIFVAEDTAL